MHRRVFADASHWIGLFNPLDQLHVKAVAASYEFRSPQIVTSEMVFTEVLNHFSERDPRVRRFAAKAVASFRESSEITIVPQTPELFARAFERYRAMSDKGWSLTDCASFIIMEDEGLTAALTHDHHFAQAGFQALLR
jgi:predicted nucleic acid-binding protein